MFEGREEDNQGGLEEGEEIFIKAMIQINNTLDLILQTTMNI